MKKIVTVLLALSLTGFLAAGQSVLERMKERTKNAVEQAVGEKVEKGVNDVLNGNIGKKNKKEKEAEAEKAETARPEAEPAAKPAGQPGKQVQAGYAKSDFVPGDEIFFDDPVENETVGEFPSHWDFLGGEECEIMTLDGEQAIKLSGWYSIIAPLMEEADYLPEAFTVEFDVWSNATGGSSNNDHIDLLLGSEESDETVVVTLNPAFNEEPSSPTPGCMCPPLSTSAPSNTMSTARGSSICPMWRVPPGWRSGPFRTATRKTAST